MPSMQQLPRSAACRSASWQAGCITAALAGAKPPTRKTDAAAKKPASKPSTALAEAPLKRGFFGYRPEPDEVIFTPAYLDQDYEEYDHIKIPVADEFAPPLPKDAPPGGAYVYTFQIP